jgi:hypothetical protein
MGEQKEVHIEGSLKEESMHKEEIEAEIEILEKEILGLKGEIRERAKEAYRRLLPSVDKLVYLVRSE